MIFRTSFPLAKPGTAVFSCRSASHAIAVQQAEHPAALHELVTNMRRCVIKPSEVLLSTCHTLLSLRSGTAVHIVVDELLWHTKTQYKP